MAVVFTSARSDPALLACGFDIGVDPFLQRPFNGTQLMDAVRAALRVEAAVSLD
jgi:DNA-binding response OmpR family regulator